MIHLPRIERRRSRISGMGVFALEPINKNTRIVTYAGEKISRREMARREARDLPRGRIWCFTINRAWGRDASRGGNVARYINHACRPNCYTEVVDDVIWIRAGKNIKRGDELTYQYYTGGTAGIPCACRPDCPTVL
jgi:SET domain-containing protein